MSTPFIEEDNPLFNNDGSSSLHETVDKLFNSNVGEYVALPIIVAIGDQSSGKSSVLEGLTNLPFRATAAYARVLRRTSYSAANRKLKFRFQCNPQVLQVQVTRKRWKSGTRTTWRT